MASDKNHWLLELDIYYTNRLALFSNPSVSRMRPVMRLLEYSGHGVLWLACVCAAILVSHQIELHEKLVNLLSALFLDIAAIGICKAIVRRERPSHNHDDMMSVSVDKYSFPSGHASRAVLVTVFVVVHFSLSTVNQVLLVIWALSVSVSRILLGRHHVSDILFGIVLGFVEHKVITSCFWLPRQFCESLIRPIQEELHL